MYFYSDGTYSKSIDLRKELRFRTVDISTVRKGPIVTFTKETNDKLYKSITANLLLEFRPVDVPSHTMPYYKAMMEIDTPNKFFSIYPLFKQFLGCNQFIETKDIYFMDRIIIEHLVLNDDIITEFTTDKKVDKIFSKYRMKTCMDSVIRKGRAIVLRNKKWSIIDIFDLGIYLRLYQDCHVIICLDDLETGYVCSGKFLLRLLNVREISIKALHDMAEDDIVPCEEIIEDLPFYDVEFNSSGICDILKLCLFVPQILLLEQSIYNSDVTLKVTIHSEKDLNLIITKNEARKDENVSLFHIINLMLKERW